MESLWIVLVAWAGLGLIAVLALARVLRRIGLPEDGATRLTGPARR